MTVGVSGLAAAFGSNRLALNAVAWAGVVFLVADGAAAARRALKDQSMNINASGRAMTLQSALLPTLALRLLHPHVCLDIVRLVGVVGAQHAAALRPALLVGAASASVWWFTALGFGAGWLTPLFARPRAWRWFDGFVPPTMWALAAVLLKGCVAGDSYTRTMNIWMVGGAVRDGLLGLPVTDRDWVVTGQTPQAMRAAGYTPVGKDFPVFLHPDTKEEVALARTERKTAPGYRGFSFSADPSVTLEDDLSRRDLTINAMAQDAQGVITDPFGGQRDLALKLLRHVSPAFAEDPVRILRLARFAARFNTFRVAPETTQLMRQMVDAGEVDVLVSERVWQELSRGLMEAQPSRMFEVLRSCGALAKLLPEVDRLWGVPQRADPVPDHHPEVDTGVHLMRVLDMAARLKAPLTVRFACLGQDLGKGTTPANVLPRHTGHEERSVNLVRALSERLRVPTDCRALAEVVAREHGNIHRSASLSAAELVRLLERCDALRRPERWDEILLACECDARGRSGLAEAVYEARARLNLVRLWACEIDAAEVAAQAALRGLKGPAIGEAVHAARVVALQARMAS